MKLFEKNVGKNDKTVRLAAGGILLVAAFLLQADMLVKGLIGLVGAIMLFTGVVGTCMLYTLAGINTAKK